MEKLNLSVYKIQMCYFFKEKSELRSFELVSRLYNRFKDVFSTEPQSFQLPNDAPENVPCCIWNDANTNLSISKSQLDFSFNIPTKFKWENLLDDFNKRIMLCIDEQKIVIDRVGLVSELTSSDDLSGILQEYIQIYKFNSAMECNISWLERMEPYNIWTYFSINKQQEKNQIVFDINSFPEIKLSDLSISGDVAISRCAEILKGKMTNVF